jgi:hypothetical protein
MLPFIFFMGFGSFFNGMGSGISNIFNGMLGIKTDPPDPPPTLVGTYGNLVDLPNSNIAELPPTLPTLQNPIAVSNTQNPFSNVFNMFGNIFGSSNIGTAQSGNPFGPAINPAPSPYLP